MDINIIRDNSKRTAKIIFIVTLLFPIGLTSYLIYDLFAFQIYIDKFSPVTQGIGIEEASEYSTDSISPIVIIRDDGQRHKFTSNIKLSWRPNSINEVQLIACLSKEKAIQINVCGYAGPSITRIQFVFDLILREAKTGNIIVNNSFYGSYPRYCQGEEGWSLTLLEGEHVDYSVIESWLESYVMNY